MRHYLQKNGLLLIAMLLAGEVTGQALRGFNLFPRDITLGSGTTRVVAEDSSLFWINLGGATNMLGRYQNGVWTGYSSAQLNISAGAARDLAWHDGKLWMGTSTGVNVFSTTGGSPTLSASYNNSSGLPGNEVRSLDGFAGRMAVATDDGLAVLEGGSWTVYTTANAGFPTNRVNKVRLDADNIVAVTDSGLSVKAGSQNWVHYNLTFLGVPNTTTLHAAPFGFGGVMVSASQLIYYIIGNNKVDLTEDDYFKSAISARDLSIVSGTIWGLSNLGVQSLSKRRDVYPVNVPLTNTRLNFDGKGGIYFVGVQGVYRIDSASFYSDRNNALNTAFLDIGNYKMLFSAKGDFFWDPNNGVASAEYPKRASSADPRKNVAFAGALWIGGMNNGTTLHASAQTYRQTSVMGHNFWPGPLENNGAVNLNTQRKFDKVWKVNRFDIEAFKQKHQAGQLNDPNYTIPQDILEWPGNRPGSNVVLAPFVDVNNNGNYNPMDGDYPDIKGDQMLWWIYNDAKPGIRGITEPPMGVEIAVSVYGFSCPNISADSNVLNTTFLMNLKVTNKSSNNYTNAALGLWQDVDLGNGNDDYVGCHVPLNTVYTYNGDDDDEGVNGYGQNMPSFGTTILKGPLAPVGDGKDNNRNGVIDEAGEDIGLMAHHFFNNDGTVIGNPVTGQHAYNYMTGRWRDSSRVVYGGTGFTGSSGSTNFNTSLMFPGSTDMTIGWGLGGTTQTPIVPPFPWSEANPGAGSSSNVPADRRNIAAMNGFTFNAGATQEITMAFIISRSSQNGATASVNQLFADIPKVKHWFQTGRFPSCLDLSTVSVDETEAENQLLVYPNPSSDVLYVRDEKGGQAQLKLLNMQGSLLRESQLHAGEAIINLQDLPVGIYFLQSLIGDKSQVHKIVISR